MFFRLTQLLVTRIQHELVPMKADVETALARLVNSGTRCFVVALVSAWDGEQTLNLPSELPFDSPLHYTRPGVFLVWARKEMSMFFFLRSYETSILRVLGNDFCFVLKKKLTAIHARPKDKNRSPARLLLCRHALTLPMHTKTTGATTSFAGLLLVTGSSACARSSRASRATATPPRPETDRSSSSPSRRQV